MVYEAEQISLNRRVALKVLPSHLSFSKEAVLKFQREAEAGGRQSHPGIVSIYAVGEHQGVHYIAQELVEGNYTLGLSQANHCSPGSMNTTLKAPQAKIIENNEGYVVIQVVCSCGEQINIRGEYNVTHKS